MCCRLVNTGLKKKYWCLTNILFITVISTHCFLPIFTEVDIKSIQRQGKCSIIWPGRLQWYFFKTDMLLNLSYSSKHTEYHFLWFLLCLGYIMQKNNNNKKLNSFKSHFCNVIILTDTASCSKYNCSFLLLHQFFITFLVWILHGNRCCFSCSPIWKYNELEILSQFCIFRENENHAWLSSLLKLYST